MDKDTLNGLNQDALDRTVQQLLPNHHGGTVTETSMRAILGRFAQMIANYTRTYELEGVRTASEMAVEWGVGNRRAQQFIATLHRQKGVGHKIGSMWCLSADEATTYQPTKQVGRPSKKTTEEE